MKPLVRSIAQAASILAGALVLVPLGASTTRAEMRAGDAAHPAEKTSRATAQQGYIPEDEDLDAKAFLPPPPTAASAFQDMDNAWHKRMLSLRGSQRWDEAAVDAQLAFPAAASIFSCALGIPVTERETPALYALLERTLTDIKGTADAAKALHHRRRPFLTDGTPVCTPRQLAKLRISSSYPSGHAALGWGWALILSQLAPEHAGKILERGVTFGESRTVCNVHWYSDIVAGRMVAAGTVAVLHAEADFREAMTAAKAEIAQMRVGYATPLGNCPAPIRELTDTPPE